MVRFVVLAALLGATCAARAAADGPLYQCPRNLFTNQIGEAQAKQQGCSRVVPGRLTQAGVVVEAPRAEVDLAQGAAASAAATATPPVPTANPHGTPPAAEVPGAAPLATQGLLVVPGLPATPDPRLSAAAAAPPRAPMPVAQRVASSLQRARDQDAQAILQSELARTLAALQTLQRSGNAAQTAMLTRLREDEAALRRELARLTP